MLILLRQSQKALRLVASKASFHLPGCVSEPPGEEGACEVRSVYYLLRKFSGATVVGTLTPDNLAFVVPTFLAVPTAPPRARIESDLAAQCCNCAATCWGST
ncbi:hypothetical protein PAPYR_5509 [Paratrimastix pyriformis]|uniref:Uncharacterized protein n=1 Tax=Paratrimastix pyriformis TaxID=342808 RepID=A0ABQ8UHN2_9EUKA|nr:hypothetical protein PAPYR_5499 [Paratrimastix pyriformis]KAJ4458742.1 hypothetical protein PAPYR_5509 [Paratrimastix pyriformis]